MLAVALALSLVACSGGKKDYSEIIIGDWMGDYESLANTTFVDVNGKTTYPGDSMTATYSFFEGGVVEAHIYDNDTGYETRDSYTWEISDDIVNITSTTNGFSNVRSYKINTDTEPYTLSIQGSLVPDTLTKVVEE